MATIEACTVYNGSYYFPPQKLFLIITEAFTGHCQSFSCLLQKLLLATIERIQNNLLTILVSSIGCEAIAQKPSLVWWAAPCWAGSLSP